jgi:hypothetical protein
VLGLERQPGVHAVFNLEVEGLRQYHVSPLGLLAHNNKTGCTETSNSAHNTNAKNAELSEQAQQKKPTNGETSATAYGKQKHIDWDAGEGFRKEVYIGDGNRVDALKIEGDMATIKEYKPDNQRQIRAGFKQLDRYEQQVRKQFPDVKDVRKIIEVYEPLKPASKRNKRK